MKSYKIFLGLLGSLISISALGQVPEFNAFTTSDGHVLVEDNFDPPASCSLCKEMYKARHSIKPDPKDTTQLDKVAAAHDVMLKALVNYKSVANIKTENALLDYNFQLILLFERLDHADDSPTAVERMAAYAENSQAKASYKEALSKLPESLRVKVLKRIDEFNREQDQERREEKSRKPSAATAR